jgi:hypothetical protein
MAIRVQHTPNIASYAEAAYEAALRRAAQEEAVRQQQERQASLAMEAQQFNLDTARQREQERVQALQPAPEVMLRTGQTAGLGGVPPAPATVTTPMKSPGVTPASSPAPDGGGLSTAQASVIREAMQQQGLNQRMAFGFQADAAQGEMDFRRDLMKHWQQKLQDMDAEDMQFTVQQQREQKEKINNLNALDTAYKTGRITPDQYRGAYEKLQAELMGMEGMPNPTKPKPPAPEEVLARIIEHPGLGWVTVAANGDIKVLNPPKSESGQKAITVNRTAVEKRARELAMQGMDDLARGNDALVAERAKGFMEQAHQDLMQDEQQVAELNDRANGQTGGEQAEQPEQAMSFGETVVADPAAFEKFINDLPESPAIKQNLITRYKTTLEYRGQLDQQAQRIQQQLDNPPAELLQQPAKLKAWQTGMQAEMARVEAVWDKMVADLDEVLTAVDSQATGTDDLAAARQAAQQVLALPAGSPERIRASNAFQRQYGHLVSQ